MAAGKMTIRIPSSRECLPRSGSRVRELRMGDEIVNLQFQRVGDRVMASTANPIPESVRVIVSV
jgi:hypothetical protein